ncbi:oleate hydratase [Pararobbsia silviterrae]|uniref:Oleate hydratase n=1 Tax=Pararobbsia silviterrae TaxID=1792498 RepID=A0A494Y142_9BURK|nr:oleate hydratase [Pararobbsia silviterrae]RKP55959.1 oleate hydratase [Pararobbsia silviterrae]
MSDATSFEGPAASDRDAYARAHAHASEGHFYLVGGGIASLAAAAFLCRDADVQGHRITVIEALDIVGGSLDAEGSALRGYVMRGGRMFESKYVCTYDLFSSIPTLEGDRSVTREMFEWNGTLATASKSRLVREGHRIDAPEFELTEWQILTLERIALEPEALLGATRIDAHFDAAFFTTNFWLMWRTTFAFQPWHSAVEFRRYLLRFAHLVAGFNQLRGIMRTTYNQYDSMVRPLQKWLRDRGVHFEVNTRVVDLGFEDTEDGTRVKTIDYLRGTHPGRYVLGDHDCAIVTLGSMTEGTTQGAMDRPALYSGKASAGAWALWDTLANGRPEFGKPAVFANHVDESRWVSFTTTLHHPGLFDAIRDLTGNVPGEGGLMTFAQSSWTLSIVLPHQPHFMGQPEDVQVFWGYGLSVDAPGDFVRKPMRACTGREIMTELLGHLGMPSDGREILRDAICIPCHMPYVTAQFLPRQAGDRPDVTPDGYRNLALIGQFCELPDDVVFTVEYSVRSAQTAVYRLAGLDKTPPPVYQGLHSLRVAYDALSALHDR